MSRVTSMGAPILAGATLGVMGGGQLGRMFAHAAQSMGYFTAVLDPDADSPAGRVSHYHIDDSYENESGLARLAAHCAAVTTEFENVPAASLRALAAMRSGPAPGATSGSAAGLGAAAVPSDLLAVHPSASVVAVAQDRVQEKAHFVACGVPCAPYAVIESAAQLEAVGADLLPGILKTARLGYDGKGQVRVATRAELASAWAALKQQPCVLEKMLALDFECSVIVARGVDGSMVHLPVQRNLHRDGILAVTEVFEGNMPPALANTAIAATKKIANDLSYVGVLCVEFFVLQSGGLVVNEMAPRPHNSGHYSLNACDVSQFELQVRTLAGLPLTPPRQHSSAIMLNLLGELWLAADGHSQEPPWAQVLALPGTHLHLYGKTQARVGRKMGHLNVTAATPAQARAVALQAAKLLGFAPF